LDLRGSNWLARVWKRLHNEELHNLYASPIIIITPVKSRRMGWTVHVAHMGRWETYTKFRSETLKGRDHSEDLDVDNRTILELILEK
jgi:hypothetical protein